MKKIFSIALFAALMVSCNNFDIENEGVTPDGGATTGDAIEFYAEESTKTTYFEGEGLGVNWEEGDQIAVRLIDSNIVYPGANDTTPDYRRRTNYTANSTGSTTEFTALANNWSNGEMKWLPDTYEGVVKEGYEHLNGQPIDNNIVAYYPATNNASPNNVGITLPTSQTQAKAGDHSHIGDLMVMKTERMTWKAGEEKPARVGLKFRNVYSIIELTLKSNESGKQISKVEINSASTALTFSASSSVNFFTTFEEDDANGLKTASGATPSKGVKSVNTTLTEPAALTAEGAEIYFVVLPGEHANGDLTITTHFTDGTSIDQKMGSIKFEMNKVYRPTLELENLPKPKTYATIKHVFSDSYSAIQVPFVDGAKVFNERNYGLYNIPDALSGFEVATIAPATHPTTNKIVATTAGYAYLLIGAAGDFETFFEEKGWTPATTIVKSTSTTEPAGDVLYYLASSKYTPVVLYERYMEEGEEFDLTQYTALVQNFQGIRPVAKEIINESDNLTLYLDFTTNEQGWAQESSFNNVNINAYEGVKPYQFPDGSTYDFIFSRTEITTYKDDTKKQPTDGGGCALHDDGYLLVYVRFSGAESIGLPAIEGYKLTNVSGKCNQANIAPIVGISSVAAPNAPEYVSDTFTFVKQSTTAFTLAANTDTQANTNYYFYVSKNGGNNDPRITYMTLTYEKAN